MINLKSLVLKESVPVMKDFSFSMLVINMKLCSSLITKLMYLFFLQMPEISAAHKSVQQFALQILGMSSGVLLMLLIAIYEGDLMTIFSTN